MSDEEYLNMFIKEAKKAYKTIDNKSYNFPITINTAYKLAVSIEKCLKKQPDIVRCKDCKWYAERISWCDNCGLPREQTFFCADGRRKGGEENE